MGIPWLSRPTIAMFPDLGYTESIRVIDGRAYRVRTWTAPQWARTPEGDRPALASPHGDGWIDTRPA